MARLAELATRDPGTNLIQHNAVRNEPGNPRKQESLAHLTFDTPLGPLTLTADAEGLTAVDFKSVPGGAATPLLAEARRQIAAYFTGTQKEFSLPLNPTGTPFQRRVWAALSAIPYGETRTYGALARNLGSGPRAVGGACGKNPLPLIVPCHRVLASTGLGGYSGGEGGITKTALLRLEGAA